uniref:YDG domain-containing protein n=1 Tax=viral metagenome TaxID=1070528 RepID=A0A6C0KL96_9ZZZZ
MPTLTITITSVSKVYNGSKTGGANVVYTAKDGATTITLSNPVIAAEYDDKNVGTTTGTVTITLTNASDIISYSNNGSNYYAVPFNTGTITPKSLPVTGVTANDKIYDGNANAILSGGSISPISGDDVTLNINSRTGVFADKNVGPGKSVTVTGYTIIGQQYGNYSLVQPTGVTANITQKPLTITGVTASNKEYNGNTTATFSNTGTLSGLVNSETLTHTVIGTFDSANAGSRTVTATVTLNNGLNGGLTSNYSITNPITTNAIISKKPLTVNGDEVSRKPYDGNRTATLSGTPVLAGIVSSDTVTINTRTATYDTPNASINNNKTVTIVTTLSGTAAGNYIVNDTTTTGKIDPKLLTVGTLVVSDKAYDGTTDATIITGDVSGIINSEIIASLSASFASKNAIASQIVTATMTLSNGSGLASNYSVPTVNPTTSANITAKLLTITGVTAADKIYDGTTVASFSSTGTLNGLVLTETLTTTLNGSFADTDLGTSKPVTAKVTLANGTNGGLASNYSITNPTGLTASIIAPFVFRYPSVKFSTTKFSSFKPSVFGEMTPTQWKILSKTLPSGITINSKTGVISGTAAARFDELSVIVYASKDSYTARYSLSIKCE